ncbi:crotonase/enoyl-CoA hydratase family protein [Nisaea sp.]|uniref:crotonase/enoyl-CoA hydratase family protein n=1 Tax=Nisaea sp. TaxID=2024842 RepID=UPI0032F062EC
MSDPVLTIEARGEIAVLSMNRPDKRNAMCDALLQAIDAFFLAPPPEIKAVVLTGAGGHFCSGLDLSEHVARDAEGTMRHSRSWHAVMDRIQFGGLPVVSALSGAVIGGGLELATATHVRLAEPSTIFQLPEGRRGIFVGGGASVRVGRILGADRMIEMMLTGRRYSAEEGLALGLTHYAVGEGEALGQALDLAAKIASNAPLSNYIMIQALSRIEDMSKADGLFTESLCAALTQTSPDAVEGLAAFLEKRMPKFGGAA